MGYNKFAAGGAGGRKANPMAEFSAGGFSALGIIVGCLSIVSNAVSFVSGIFQRKNAGIDRYPDLTYKKLSGNEFDMDGMGVNEESLTEFLDDAEQDDFAPRVYGQEDKRDSDKAAPADKAP